MAVIGTSNDEKIFKITDFYGLNESPDGDSKLKLGEAAVMRNFKVTKDKSLQKRPGTKIEVGMGLDYIIKVSNEVDVVKVDNNISSILNMGKSVRVSITGIVFVVYVDLEQVTFENQSQYVDYYWEESFGRVWQFVSCDYDNITNRYSWKMKRVNVVPDGVDDASIKDVWTGVVGDKKWMLSICNNTVMRYDFKDMFARSVGEINPAEGVTPSFFSFGKKVYVLTGNRIYFWDGSIKGGIPYGKDLQVVSDLNTYVPLVSVSIPPGKYKAGTLIEPINIMCDYRRCWISPDGTSNVFQLPEYPINTLQTRVVNRITGEEVSITNYDQDLERGQIEFKNISLEEGVNTYEIRYAPRNAYSEGNPVYKMTRAELYNGTNDSRVFYYGDGTNRVYYSDVDYDGNPRADYVPELNFIDIGESNTPVTALVRNYSRLIAFKTDSVYSIQYGTVTLPDGTFSANFFATPVNKAVGNEAMGQVEIVENAPVSLHEYNLFEWINPNGYNSAASVDERQAKRISDKIYATLKKFDFSKCYCFNDQVHQEYYICYDKKAVVWNYAVDAWYYYTDFDVTAMATWNGELYAGDSLGRINHISNEYRTDNGLEFKCYWESGSESFGRDFMRKYSSMIWVVVKPELRSEVSVTIQTDRKSNYSEKLVSSSLFTFGSADFRKWSFNTNMKPKSKRLKLKAKKFVFYKLIFEVEGINTTATVLSSDMKIRYTGYAR